MKYTRCLEKLRAPLIGVLLGVIALGFSSQSASAHPLKVQGCIKLDGVLTQGVTVEAFDTRTCTSIISTVTDRNGDFVIIGLVGSFNENTFLQISGPNGCLQIVDNQTLLNSVITDPNDPRFGFIALCVDVPCACVPCTTGVSRVVLQYLGTTPQVITAWGAATQTGSKKAKIGSKATALTCNLWGKSGHSEGHKIGSKCLAAPVATPIFVATVNPCTTFTVDGPMIPIFATGSKAKKAGILGQKIGSKKGVVPGLTIFVGNNVNTRLDLSCLSGVQTGQIIGMFKVIRLENELGQRVCVPQLPPPTGNCVTGATPTLLTFQFMGGNCSTSANSQPRGTKFNCTDFGTGCNGPVTVVISSNPKPCTTGFFAGTVGLDQTFCVRAPITWSKSKKHKSGGLGGTTYVYVYCGGVLVERIQIDTSCSSPLKPGDRFGCLKLINCSLTP